MKVVLRQDVDKLGYRGDVVEVARGYARNFLLPRRLADEATPGRVSVLERRDALRARHEAKTFDEARALADRLTEAELRFDVKAGPTGALFGSVTPTNIVDALWDLHKIRVDRRKVDLAEPIRRIGRYAVPIDLFPDVRVELTTLVVPEGGELPPEAEAETEVAPAVGAGTVSEATSETVSETGVAADPTETSAETAEPEAG